MEIPIIPEASRVWLVRTQSGNYYQDFYINNFVALGWDKILYDFIQSSASRESKIDFIKQQYPDEQRPGLIFGQLETFIYKMKKDDYVFIPSSGSTQIAIGILGDIVNEITHKETFQEEQYAPCEYKLKRNVNWLKRVDTHHDIYLYKILRAQQAISDMTKYSELIFRNLNALYICNDKIHLTLTKVTGAPFALEDSVNLYSSILSVRDAISEILLNKGNENIEIKTAISSPGFTEIIQTVSPVAIGAAVVVFQLLKSKYAKDGNSFSGISAFIKSISDLINDKTDRDYKRAETKKVEAETLQINVSTQKEFLELQAWQAENRDKLEALEKTKIVLQSSAKNTGIELIEDGKKVR